MFVHRNSHKTKRAFGRGGVANIAIAKINTYYEKIVNTRFSGTFVVIVDPIQ